MQPASTQDLQSIRRLAERFAKKELEPKMLDGETYPFAPLNQDALEVASELGFLSLVLPEETQAEFDAMIAEAKSLADPAEQHEAYKAIQRKATDEQTSIWGPQATGRRWEPLWMEGWFYNPAFPCPFVYGYTETDASPHPKTYIEASIGDPETFDPAYMYDTSSSCWVWRSAFRVRNWA